MLINSNGVSTYLLRYILVHTLVNAQTKNLYVNGATSSSLRNVYIAHKDAKIETKKANSKLPRVFHIFSFSHWFLPVARLVSRPAQFFGGKFLCGVWVEIQMHSIFWLFGHYLIKPQVSQIIALFVVFI